MSAGDGNWTAVFSGTVNRLAPTAGAGAVGPSLDGSNCHGVSGAAGARSRVSSQAPSNAHPARALRRNLADGTHCVPDRQSGRRVRLRINLIENIADVPNSTQHPRRERWEVIIRFG